MLSPRTLSWRTTKQLVVPEGAALSTSNKMRDAIKEALDKSLPQTLRCAPDLSTTLKDKALLPLFELWADANLAGENIRFSRAFEKLELAQFERTDAIAEAVEEIRQRFICENGQDMLNVSGRCRLAALEGLRVLAVDHPTDPVQYQQRACLLLSATKIEVQKMLLTDVYPSFASLIEEVILLKAKGSSQAKIWSPAVSPGANRRSSEKTLKLGSGRKLSRESEESKLSHDDENEDSSTSE